MTDFLNRIGIDVDQVIGSLSSLWVPALKAVGIFVFAFAFYWIFSWILRHSVARIVARTRTEIDDIVVKHSASILKYIVFIVAAALSVRTLGIEILDKIFYAVLIVLVGISLERILSALLDFLEHRVASKTETKIDDAIFRLLHSLSKAIVYSVAVILALDVIGINITPFLAGAGVAGIAIGFAAKDTLSNLIAGVILIMDRPFELNDRIEIWNAPQNSSTWGDVVHIGLRATKIQTTDNIIVIIPNNELMRRDIINYTALSDAIRIRVRVGIAYDADVEKAREVMLKVADVTEGVMKEPVPRAVVVSFGASSVDLELRVWIHDARRRLVLISELTGKIKKGLDDAGVEIPYPKRDIYIKSSPGNFPVGSQPGHADLDSSEQKPPTGNDDQGRSGTT
jgi:small-conductance mechanosensitive channel